MDLDARKQKILQAIIQDYISSAEPVGSRTIARKYDLGVSAATIRNEMFDLEIMGYLEQPHTSSGRIPSLKGYRFYVDYLLKPTKITDAEKQFVRAWFQDKVSSVDQIFQSTAKLLARITHNVTLVMASQRLNSKLKYIRFLPLDDRRAIMIVVTDTGQVENCIYPKPAGASLDDLNIIAQRLTNYLAGMAMDHIDEKAIEAFHETIVDDVELYRLAFRAMGRAFHKDQQFYKGGTMELLNKPEFKDVDKAKSLFTMLEEQDVVANLLHDEGEGGAVTVRIGEEAKLSSINDCSIIEATFTDHDVVLGKLAVLGPARMEYAKIIGLLDFMKQHVTHMLAHYHDDK
ncbi:MAG: heat-inducible transcriptional repressor HrcA [Limosilactobacillus oris]|jgi:heat-inducible transcriptional repressor|uniref:heat-inducible transcriptional repressor HrcA n=1 Tax=Megasphaera sp. TaxID=2023260 RepID=UPI0025C68EB9|nr:heat-inducible transcriptional repressor HrcA [Megasphaera sp.]MCH3902730.1 heat-inducible transcriptional repressor HrcA [Limosilactobacillus oris]MCH3932213.1 heat-inducible transcriptional repressor HrcA [Megasphaera sp.]MCI1888570.1 heat-inducible transcriptional repressor HrcA [Sporolactobacillus sp.]MCI1906335.1 heat-inducible transcriptional repressor HrcA [Enterococcaceae bacterium]